MSDYYCVVFGIERSSWSDDDGISANDIFPSKDGVDWLEESTVNNQQVKLFSAKLPVSEYNDIVADFEQHVEGCEVYVNAPCPVPLFTPHSFFTWKPDLEMVDMQRRFQKYGLLVMDTCLDMNTINNLLKITNPQIDAAMEQLHRLDIQHPFSFREISSRGPKRFDLLLHEKSLPDIRYPWHEFVSDILGNDFVLDLSVVYSLPGAQDQGWHADGNHLSHDAGWRSNGSTGELSEPYALCVFVPLVDLDDSTGFTQFWPKSHAYKGLVGLGPCAPVLGATWDGKCRTGAAILYDYRLLHRGMANNTEQMRRPVLQFLYHKPWYKEINNYGSTSLWTDNGTTSR